MIKYNIYKNLADNEKGSALIFAIVILAVLTIIGIFSITTSTIEIKIADNDKVYKTSFYAADGGTEVGREMIEQNIACADGFKLIPLPSPLTAGSSLIVEDLKFAFKENEPTLPYPSDTVRDLHFPANDAQPHTNLVVFGKTVMSPGSALQMAAGYEGKGKGAAGGGAKILYDVYSKHDGNQKSQAQIMIKYRHILGQEGDCNY